MPNFHPLTVEQQLAKLRREYEELRRAIDNGNESMTHYDAVRWVEEQHQKRGGCLLVHPDAQIDMSYLLDLARGGTVVTLRKDVPLDGR